MLPLLLAAVLAVPQTGFAFGRTGGSIRPFTVTIAVDGRVAAYGAAPAHRRRLTRLQLADLNRAVFETRFAALPAYTGCPATLPDVATQFIRVGRRVVRAHGGCVEGFNRLWSALGRYALRR